MATRSIGKPYATALALLLASPVALAQQAAQQGQANQQPAATQQQSTAQSQAGSQPQAAAQNQATQQQAGRTPTVSVEELNDNMNRYRDQRVAVRGEIEEYLGPSSFVLESGGIFDDEITVIIPENVQGIDPNMLREDSDIVVHGAVRQMTQVEIEREMSWDFDPEIEAEFEGTRSYLVAERITRDRG
jgi:uncharacterized protein YdeI (BOF family)